MPTRSPSATRTASRCSTTPAKLPDANILWSPRAGFNWNVDCGAQDAGPRRHGHLHGPPGVRVDLEPDRQHGRADRVRAARPVGNAPLFSRPFNPDPNAYKPTQRHRRAGRDATSWRSPTRTSSSRRCGAATSPSTGVCRGASPAPPSTSTRRTSTACTTSTPTCRRRRPASPGADNRPRYTNNRIHSNIANAIVLKNQNVGDSWNLAFTGNKSFKGGFVKAAYSYGEAKNTVDAGSIAFGSWNNNQHPGDPNNPGIGYAAGSAGPPLLPHRVVHEGVLRVRRHDVLGLLRGPDHRQHQLRVLGRPQRRRRHEQRPASTSRATPRR